MKTPTVLVVTLTLSTGAVQARGQTPVRLEIDEAISRAIQTSHRLAEIDARRSASMAAVQLRSTAGRPVVSLQAGYVRTNHVDDFVVPDASGRPFVVYADVPDNVRTRVDLQWPIYTGGRTDALERAARSEADALGHDRAAAQADLKLEVTRAYWAVVTAQASVRVLEQALTRMDAHLADTRSRLEAGLVPPSDVLSTEAQRSRQDMLLIEARNLQESALADLRRLCGLPPDAAVDIDATLAPPAAPAALPAAMVGQARADRPERKAVEFRMQSADQLLAAADAGRLPSIAVTGGYDYAHPNNRNFPRLPEWNTGWDLGVSVSWALWDSGRVKSEVAQAAANRQAVEEGLREFDAALESEVRQQRLSLESALAAIAPADAAVRSATEARRVVDDRYASGIGTNRDTLDAQLALVQAELDRTRAIANARLAAARLDRVLGR